MADQAERNDALFQKIGSQVEGSGVAEEQRVVEEITSLCMNCHKDGTTRLLLTRIPYFREIVIMSFDCPECGFRNSEVQPAGEIQPKGARHQFKVDSSDDLSRQIVKSDTCSVRIEEADLEIPPGRGQMTNVEGVLTMVAQDLELKQPERKEVALEVHDKIQTVIDKLYSMARGEQTPFVLVLDDPAGNSFIEPSPQDPSGKWSKSEYVRTAEQNEAIGLSGDAEAPETNGVGTRPEYRATQMYPNGPAASTTNNVDDDEIIENQVYSFPASCPGCTRHCATNMKMVNIPYFKQVVLMSTVCDHCGYRSNEVKTGGEVPEQGRRITVSIQNTEDLSRDILKSESCALSCPELELSVEPGTMGGRFTTIEGLLTQVRDDLRASVFDIGDSTAGDSMPATEKERWNAFFDRLDVAIRGEMKFSVVLEDPLASSYVQSFTAPDPDGQIKLEDYDRTEQEEEELGLKDMKTEGYEENAN